MKTTKLAILVIMYKIKISDCQTINSLLRCINSDDITLYVWDNSPEPFLSYNKNFHIKYVNYFDNFEYFGNGKNHKLSEVYNRIGDKFLKSNSYDYLIILDHDSTLNENFLMNLKKEIIDYDKPNLITPIAKNIETGLIISPKSFVSRDKWRPTSLPLCKNYHTPGPKKTDNFFAIGSGLTISNETWNDGLRFDENLNIYGVDSEFCIDYSKLYNSYLLSKNTILHDVSSPEKDNLTERVRRINNKLHYHKYMTIKHNHDFRVYLMANIRYIYALTRTILSNFK